jgi:hypothetical protein
MSLPPPEFQFATPIVHVTAWEDPVVDLLGHDPRSPYVERFWLAILGPSTTFLMRHTATALETQPEGFDLDLQEAARALGLGTRGGHGAPFVRALARTAQFHLSRAAGSAELMIRRRMPPLSRQQVLRLPPALRDEHDAYQQAAQAQPSMEERRTRARRLALSLLELGETEEATELQLHRWKIHPALAHDSLRWAQLRRGERPAMPPGANPHGPANPAPAAVPPAPVLSAAASGAPQARSTRPRIGARRPAPMAQSFGPEDSPGDAA